MQFLRNVTHKVLQITHGRTTAFFIAFFVMGNLMALLGKLSYVYVAYMSTLGSLVLLHSTKDDWAAKVLGARPLCGPDAPPAPPNA